MTLSQRLSYIPGLDGIRAVAVLAVLCYHADAPWALGGFLGVETFFVLSGFLITSLLLKEWQSSGRIDLKHFWLRRARRLLPAVWLLLLVLPILAFLVAKDALPRLQEDIPAAFFYITNWVYIVREVPYFEGFGRPPLLQQLWSLAVEEQFYLLWPLLLLGILRMFRNYRHGALCATLFLTALSSVWMAALYSPATDPLRVYYGTDTRAAGFLIGAMLAMVWSPQEQRGTRQRGIHEFLGWAGLAALLILFNQLNEFQPLLYRGGILLTAGVSALLILGASSPGTWLGRALEVPVLRWIGSRSYSIYLWHWPVFMISRPGFDLTPPAWLVRAGQIAITFLLAELSYRWIETPVRQHGFRAAVQLWRDALPRWSLRRRVGVGAGAVCVVLFAIWQGMLSPATATAIVAETPTRAVTSTRQAASVVAITKMPATPTRTARLHSPVTPTAAPAGRRATLIGDSIMQGATPMIEDVFGAEVYIDAARKRKMEDVPALVETLAQDGNLSPVVVIHLGSNRPFEAEVFDDAMESLLEHQVERVIFINVHRPIGWEEYINQKFAEGVARWPQAEMLDWDALAHSQQGWFIRDQTHLSYAGSEAYVNAIKEKLVNTR